MRKLLFFVPIAVACAHAAPEPDHVALKAPLTCDSAVIYGASWCKPCTYAERHLKRRGVTKIVDRDVENDEEAMRFLRELRTGSRHVPIPVIDLCGTILYGYDPDSIDDALTKPRVRDEGT